ncbi:hypothetical protein A6U87_27440 [Rhizobium sp. AC44/96]|uniref:hypothetical protein n=1 Tax=Rhizobium sp. AC44/96 TaxID=1841654 RepID=UPI00080FE102|nr:hypothetical protein [Rhizobium sp. AC44/96]OCJ11479.1 hypothetical protein A6U87_27440 [Rhizobium sp. AC44/96]
MKQNKPAEPGEPTLDEFTIPHVAFAAAEHYAVHPQSDKGELIKHLRQEVETRYGRERGNTAGHSAALQAIQDADTRGLLEAVYGQGE